MPPMRTVCFGTFPHAMLHAGGVSGQSAQHLPGEVPKGGVTKNSASFGMFESPRRGRAIKIRRARIVGKHHIPPVGSIQIS